MTQRRDIQFIFPIIFFLFEVFDVAAFNLLFALLGLAEAIVQVFA